MFLPPFVRVIYLVLWVKMNKGHNNATTTHKVLRRLGKIYIEWKFEINGKCKVYSSRA